MLNARHELHAAIVVWLLIFFGIYAVSRGGHIQADTSAMVKP